ncbi:hypothetical protein GOODEAATRI_021009 [Goodea atripinnis]|uniref:Uncharacterized protein n=1 Tax=Goodea atripinnis TaxID=208336 RepID=A0ABV0MVW6_9TELE
MLVHTHKTNDVDTGKKTKGANDGWVGHWLGTSPSAGLVVVLVTACLTLFSPLYTPCRMSTLLSPLHNSCAPHDLPITLLSLVKSVATSKQMYAPLCRSPDGHVEAIFRHALLLARENTKFSCSLVHSLCVVGSNFIPP